MNPLNSKKTIVALGHPSSGKSCYMQVAISYLYRYGKDFKITMSNTDLDKITDRTQEILREGKWPEKTRQRNIYQFELSTWKGLVKCNHTLIDWMGESFTAAGRERPGLQGLEPSGTMKEFVDACKNADGFLLFLDGERLLESGKELDGTRDCLYWLKDLIKENKKKRRFSILVTKSDFLEGTGEHFGTDDGEKVDEKKIYNFIRDRYNSFFKTLESNSYPFLVAPVTCLPVREHRMDNEKGTFASEDWELKDMEQTNVAAAAPPSDMIVPLRWLIKTI